MTSKSNVGSVTGVPDNAAIKAVKPQMVASCITVAGETKGNIEDLVGPVYVAGTYRADTLAEIDANIQRARSLARWLWSQGYVVFCPHANSGYMDGAAPDSLYMGGSLFFLKKCASVVVLSGWQGSEGTTREIALAKSLGMPIWLADVEGWCKHNWDLEKVCAGDLSKLTRKKTP